ncbi:hypothetical protein CBR_g29715 [Chara braunii]|uniref:Piwi domain-containing protein n=1 Tax=Chara braunii TaxID=69332 RepID=A0A388LB90_CHABU|nr:hypothetical protein CBR_g29715 [Chara braunii]|eukprot:GBG79568.1 hypothetical protein CBR_g29715 [Chara braunii]
MGGINSLLEAGAMKKYTETPTILIGMDVSHGSAMERDSFSIAARPSCGDYDDDDPDDDDDDPDDDDDTTDDDADGDTKLY